MADEKDILFAMFKEYLDEGFYHLEQRTATANVILVLAGATVGLITFDQKLGGTDIFAAYFLIGLGLFGMLWSAKHHERYNYFLERARGYREKLGEFLPQIDMIDINKKAEEKAKKKYRVLFRIQLWYLWTFLYLMITALGILIAVFYFLQPTK
ncbi:MAG: hypothetical protein NT169_10610 [Chloroflexi bacterium]|nr:hypothetical protein [Chloroflexota bacterium]